MSYKLFMVREKSRIESEFAPPSSSADVLTGGYCIGNLSAGSIILLNLSCKRLSILTASWESAVMKTSDHESVLIDLLRRMFVFSFLPTQGLEQKERFRDQYQNLDHHHSPTTLMIIPGECTRQASTTSQHEYSKYTCEYSWSFMYLGTICSTRMSTHANLLI